MSNPKGVGVQGWRQKPLPGVNAPVPPGSVGIAITPKMNRELTKLLRTFDNAKAVLAMAPYAESAADVAEAILEELAEKGFPVGPTVIEKVQTSGLMRMWGRFLFDRAAETQDARLADMATRIAVAADTNFAKAHELHAQIVESSKGTINVDPLAAFGEPPAEFADETGLTSKPGFMSVVTIDDAPVKDSLEVAEALNAGVVLGVCYFDCAGNRCSDPKHWWGCGLAPAETDE